MSDDHGWADRVRGGYERRVGDRVRHQQERVDPVLTRFGFSKSFRLDDRIHLYTTCERCGALLPVSDRRGEDVLNLHWRSHHRIRFVIHRVLDGLLAWASSRAGR